MRSGDFQRGDTFKIKQGTRVYFGRGGGQQNNEGKQSWITDKDFTVEVDNPKQHILDSNGKETNKLADHHVSFHVVDKGWKTIPDTQPPNVGDRIHEQ